MKRWLAACVWALSAYLIGAAAHAADQKQPHIIFVLADDLGPGDLGCYGGTIAPTPHIDQLATGGLRFTQFYAAAPVCSPSRCGLITGQFPARWRIHTFLQTVAGDKERDQADFLDPNDPSLPRLLKQAGYKTAHIGKWHLGGGRDVVNPPKFAAYGYDEGIGTWESPEPHPDITASDWIWSDKDKVKRWKRTEFFVDRTLDFLKRHDDSPCFVNLWLDDTHTPWVPSADASAKSQEKADLQNVITEMDRQIGRLRDGLRRLGIEDSTLLIFTADNGPLPAFRGERTAGLRGSKISLYEGGIREPFIACWPKRISADAVNRATVMSNVDMLPTLCAIAGAKVQTEAHSDGENLSAAVLGQSTPERTRPLFWEYGWNDKFAKPRAKRDQSPPLAVRDGKWKLLVNADGSGAELYDISADEKETHNLAAQEPEVAKRLTALVLQWRKSLPK
jgi:arylsulfatase A-like enzyme